MENNTNFILNLRSQNASKINIFLMSNILVLTSLFGFIGNGFSIFLLIFNIKKCNKYNFLVLLLNISELSFCCCVILMSFISRDLSILKNQFICSLVFLEPTVFHISSSYLIFSIYVFKYLNIRYPFKFNELFSKYFIIMMIAYFLIGLISLTFPFITKFIENDKTLLFGVCNGLLFYTPHSTIICIGLFSAPFIIGSIILHLLIITIARNQKRKIINFHRRFNHDHQIINNISKSALFCLSSLILNLLVMTIFNTALILNFPSVFSSPVMLCFATVSLVPTINPWLMMFGHRETKESFYEFLYKCKKFFRLF